jgi:hypothetical protein
MLQKQRYLHAIVGALALGAAGLQYEAGAAVEIPASAGLPTSKEDTSKPGFVWNFWKLDPSKVDSTLLGAFEGNNTADTELAIAGFYQFSDADPTAVGIASGTGTWLGTPNQSLLQFIIPTTINLDKAGGSNGNFTPDDQMPGVPGTSGVGNGTDGIAAEILYWVEIPAAGTITFGVNSDDGFRTKVGGVAPRDVFAQVAGEFNGGRGAADTTFDIKFDGPGVYAFRTTYENGGGGANIEMFSEKADGTKVLLNDTANGGLKVFRDITGGTPAYVSSLSPGPGGTIPYGGSINVAITDGASQAVDASSVKLLVDGAAVTAAATKSGSTTSLSYTPATPFASGSSHNAELDYSAGGTAVTKTWTFVSAKYAYLTKDLAVTPDTSKPGFIWDYFQNELDGNNFNYVMEQVLSGNWGLTNNADITVQGIASGPGKALGSSPSSMIEWEIPTVINMSKTGGDTHGNFTPDDQEPGTPGTTGATDGQKAVAWSYLDLPAGTLTMGVNSDDGFRVYAGSVHDALAKQFAGEFDGGRGAADTTFQIVVKDAGVYPFRLEWENGGGDSNVEWYTVNGTNKVLINDTANGGIKAYRAVTSATPPYIASVTPEPSGNYTAQSNYAPFGPTDGGVDMVQLLINDGSTAKVDSSSVQLSVDSSPVTPTVNSASGVTTVTYKPAARFADNSDHTATITYKDSAGVSRSNTWPFHVGYISTDTLFIESEDADYGHGQTVTTGHIGMDGPYDGGAFNNLGDTSDLGFDWNATGPNGQVYRSNSGLSAGKPNGTAFNGRGYFKTKVWWTLGWNNAGDWENYTRTFPSTATDYEVFGHLASGGSPIGIELDQITGGVGQDDSSQTKKMLGVFSPGRATAGWDNLEIFQLAADTNGTPTTVNLSGKATLRVTMLPGSAEDMDYLAFRPKATTSGGGGGGGNTNIVFSAISVSADKKSATLTYSGTLQSADNLKGPWTPVTGATSPATITIANTGNKFYRVQ